MPHPRKRWIPGDGRVDGDAGDDANSAAGGERTTGGRIVARMLRAQGVARIYGVPGESFLEVLDALLDEVSPADVPPADVSGERGTPTRFVSARHEGAAAMMADADGKMTGRPGVAIVTRGPGATNASAGIHVAAQDSTPLVLLVGLVGRGDAGREAFQEFDLAATFADAKLALTVPAAARLPEMLGRAWSAAMSGRPGPVVVGLPEDVLREGVPRRDVPRGDVPREGVEAPAPVRRIEPVVAAPAPDAVARLAAMLERAERPLVVAGGETWTGAARRDLVRFSEAHRVPVAASFRAQDRFPNDHPHYAGHVGLGIDPALAARVRGSDCLIVAGARLGDATTGGYALLPVPDPGVPLVHAHPDANEIGRVYRPALGIATGMAPFAAALAALPAALPATPPAAGPDRAAWVRGAHADYLARSTPADDGGDRLDLARIVARVSQRIGPRGIIANGAGNYAIWVHRFARYGGFHGGFHGRADGNASDGDHWRTQLAPTSGTMGYGLPAAIAAKLRHPDRAVVAFAGDGCFQMTCAELGTAVQEGGREGAVPLVVVCDNGQYGTIRMHQEARHPGRVSGTALRNPDFAALARAYGLRAETPADMPAFDAALDAMLDGGGLIHLRLDAAEIAPGRFIAPEGPSGGSIARENALGGPSLRPNA